MKQKKPELTLLKKELKTIKSLSKVLVKKMAKEYFLKTSRAMINDLKVYEARDRALKYRFKRI